MATVPQEQAGSSGRGGFATTHWTVVLQAGDSHSPEADVALEQLCRAYWYPLYAFVRRKGSKPEDAQDVTQAFFSNFLRRRDLKRADPGKGRFRTFLLTCFQNFETSEWRKSKAQKRGGGMEIGSLDAAEAEGRYIQEAMDDMSPEAVYERKCALSVLYQALARWEASYRNVSPDLARELKNRLWHEESAMPYKELAVQLGRSVGTLKSDVSRARQVYQDCLLEVVRETVADQNEVNDELQYLLRVFGG